MDSNKLPRVTITISSELLGHLQSLRDEHLVSLSGVVQLLLDHQLHSAPAQTLAGVLAAGPVRRRRTDAKRMRTLAR